MFYLSTVSILIQLDWELFQCINSSLSNTFFDEIMPFLRNKWLWLPLYILVITWMIIRWKKLSWMVIFFFLFSAGASDYLSASVIKPLVRRERPCQVATAQDQVKARIDCGVGYSFPSAHASNHMAMGLYLFLLFGSFAKKGKYLFLLWPFLVSFAQIYVGVHFPADVLAGWLLGTIIAIACYYLLKFYFRYFYNRSISEPAP
jgi:membrane-associated phospholipid phosphatase